MSSFTFVVFCFAVCLVQNVFGQYNLGGGWPGGVGLHQAQAGPGCSSGCGSYGGVGNGDVDVSGDLPVSGQTVITGNVPVLGTVSFTGQVPAGGTVSINGNCGCPCNSGQRYI